MTFLRQVHAFYRHELKWQWSIWLVALTALIITLMTGPVFILGFEIQYWNSETPWDYEDRWVGTKAFAITFILLIYLPLILNMIFFHIEFLQFWLRYLFAPAWYNPFLWWFVLLPLAPTVALILERIDPRTKPLERILLPSELPPQPTVTNDRSIQTKIKQRKKSAWQSTEKRNDGSAPQRRKTSNRDPRPIYEAWAPQQLPLTESISAAPTTTPSAMPPSTSTSNLSPESHRDVQDEGESLQDIF